MFWSCTLWTHLPERQNYSFVLEKDETLVCVLYLSFVLCFTGSCALLWFKVIIVDQEIIIVTIIFISGNNTVLWVDIVAVLCGYYYTALSLNSSVMISKISKIRRLRVRRPWHQKFLRIWQFKLWCTTQATVYKK